MEIIMAIAIVAILIALVMVLTGSISIRSKRAKAQAEIMTLLSACEAYKTEHGGYPQDDSPSGTSVTDTLDPRIHLNAATPVYTAANLFLYKQLTGDNNANGAIDSGETGRTYAGDFFKASRYDLGFTTSGTISYFKDPFGNPYGYSTAGLKAEQNYRVLLQTNSTAPRLGPVTGYNPTFDLWSTGDSPIPTKWIKNW
jgi:type II secretory pathway pseudopilin PulG